MSTTLSSLATSATRSAGNDVQPGADTRARARGWRVRTPDVARAARPNSTTRRMRDICSARTSSMSVASAVGHAAMWTLGAASGSTGKTMSCQTRSVTNGVKGAMTRVRVRRASSSVASAAGSPSQKRRRERRTYQLERSSMKPAMSRPARCVSNVSRAASTSRASRWDSLRTQRSRAGRFDTGGADADDVGDHCAARAYRDWKDTVFQ